MSYEEIRRKNLEDNRRILAELGLVNPFKPIGRVVNKGIKRKPVESKQRKRKANDTDLSNYGSIHGKRRKSARIQGKPADAAEDLDDSESECNDENYKPRCAVPPRPKVYGHLTEVEVGTMWQTRMECSRDGIHRPTVAGIHGGVEGAFSIALSGGYDDNIDLGECFTYTGEGGRDLRGTPGKPKNLRTAPQSKDQTLSRGNLALTKNSENGHPVRVIRGYKLTSPFAPEEGYRYDGIYTVEKYWYTTGVSGFGVWKFALRRSKDQAPPPWLLLSNEESVEETKSPLKDNEESDEETKSPLKDKEESKAPLKDNEESDEETKSPLKDKEETKTPLQDNEESVEETKAPHKEKECADDNNNEDISQSKEIET